MKKAIQKLQQMLDWSDRIGSDEVNEIQDIILLLKLENNTIKLINDFKKFLGNNIINKQQVLDLIDNHIEYLETSEGDEYPAITIENLKGLLDKHFNK